MKLKTLLVCYFLLSAILSQAQRHWSEIPAKIDFYKDIFVNKTDSIIYEYYGMVERDQLDVFLSEVDKEARNIESSEHLTYKNDTLIKIISYEYYDGKQELGTTFDFVIKDSIIIRDSKTDFYGQKLTYRDSFAITYLWTTKVLGSEFVSPDVVVKAIFDAAAKKLYDEAVEKVTKGEIIQSHDELDKKIYKNYFDIHGNEVRREEFSEQNENFHVYSKTTLKTVVEDRFVYNSRKEIIARNHISYIYLPDSPKWQFLLISGKTKGSKVEVYRRVVHKN